MQPQESSSNTNGENNPVACANNWHNPLGPQIVPDMSKRGITSQGLRARRDTVIARTIYANAPVKTKSAKPNLFGGGGRLGHVPLRARACWRKCWPCAYAPVDSMHLCRIHWFFLLCLSLCGMISLESSGVVLVQVFLNRTTATGHGANQDLTTSKK